MRRNVSLLISTSEGNDMNEVVVRTPELVPTTMAEAMRLAEMMATAKLVPVGLQKSPADCLMVIQQAVRWQMDPFAVAQECSVIQGKLMHTGKLVAAVVNARGNLTQRLSFEYSGEADNRTIVVSGQLQGEPSPRTVEVVLKNARTQNKVWLTQPDQQLMYHGVRVWARRHTPELMLGVYSPEDFDEVAPAPRPEARRPPQVTASATGEIAEDTGIQDGVEGDVVLSTLDDLSERDQGRAAYLEECREKILGYENGDVAVLKWWASEPQHKARRAFALTQGEVDYLKNLVSSKLPKRTA
jgi:hypothetical protein